MYDQINIHMLIDHTLLYFEINYSLMNRLSFNESLILAQDER